MKNSDIVEELVKIKIDIEQGKTLSAKSKIGSLVEKLCSPSGTSEMKRQVNRHQSNCMLEMDPDYYGPCTCKKMYDDTDFDL